MEVNILLLKNISESLAGRAIYLTLSPFTRREIQKSSNEPFLVRLLKTGKIVKKDCSDIKWKELQKALKDLKSTIKQHETKMQAIDKPMVDIDTGEELQPAICETKEELHWKTNKI